MNERMPIIEPQEKEPESMAVGVNDVIPGARIEGLPDIQDILEDKTPVPHEDLNEIGHRNDREMAGHLLLELGKTHNGADALLRLFMNGQPLLDLGAGSLAAGYMLARDFGSSGYVGCEPYYFDKLAKDINRETHPVKSGAEIETPIPFSVAPEGMLEFLRRLPDNSANIFTGHIEHNIMPNFQYAKEVAKEIERVVPDDGVYVSLASSLRPDLESLNLPAESSLNHLEKTIIYSKTPFSELLKNKLFKDAETQEEKTDRLYGFLLEAFGVWHGTTRVLLEIAKQDKQKSLKLFEHIINTKPVYDGFFSQFARDLMMQPVADKIDDFPEGLREIVQGISDLLNTVPEKNYDEQVLILGREFLMLIENQPDSFLALMSFFAEKRGGKDLEKIENGESPEEAMDNYAKNMFERFNEDENREIMHTFGEEFWQGLDALHRKVSSPPE